MNRQARFIFSRILEVLARVVPKTRIVTVHGVPMTEGNAVEVVNALCRRYRGRINWLVDGEPLAVTPPLPPNVDVRTKNSLLAIWLYLRSEAVFFTHGLYGDVRLPRSQTVVNLWHGDGIKVKPTSNAARRSLFPATWVSGGTRLLTERKQVDFKLASGSTLVFGNPRIAQFQDPIDPEALSALGLRPGQKFVAWLPTFRQSSYAGSPGFQSAAAVRDAMRDVVAKLRERDIAVIVKPHRQDSEDRSAAGVRTITDDDLAASEVSLYSLLGASSGLVTDFSSVWTDYLVLDRPIAFVVPDIETYVTSRGLYPSDIPSWLPGPILDSGQSAGTFAEAVAGKHDATRGQREAAARRLGLAPLGDNADRLLEALDEAGAFAGQALGPRRERVPLVVRPRGSSGD